MGCHPQDWYVWKGTKKNNNQAFSPKWHVFIRLKNTGTYAKSPVPTHFWGQICWFSTCPEIGQKERRRVMRTNSCFLSQATVICQLFKQGNHIGPWGFLTGEIGVEMPQVSSTFSFCCTQNIVDEVMLPNLKLRVYQVI